MMFKCSGCNDAVIGLANGNALLSQLARNINCPNEDGIRHWQHYQGAKIASNASMGGVIGNALEDLRQYYAAQGEVFVIEDELAWRGHMRKITTCEEVEPDAGVD